MSKKKLPSSFLPALTVWPDEDTMGVCDQIFTFLKVVGIPVLVQSQRGRECLPGICEQHLLWRMIYATAEVSFDPSSQ